MEIGLILMLKVYGYMVMWLFTVHSWAVGDRSGEFPETPDARRADRIREPREWEAGPHTW